jgi:hypothetical protein
MSVSNMSGVKIYKAKSLETLECYSNLALGWHYVYKLRFNGSNVDNILHRNGLYLGGI